jgi:hypothetical protein
MLLSLSAGRAAHARARWCGDVGAQEARGPLSAVHCSERVFRLRAYREGKKKSHALPASPPTRAHVSEPLLPWCAQVHTEGACACSPVRPVELEIVWAPGTAWVTRQLEDQSVILRHWHAHSHTAMQGRRRTWQPPRAGHRRAGLAWLFRPPGGFNHARTNSGCPVQRRTSSGLGARACTTKDRACEARRAERPSPASPPTESHCRHQRKKATVVTAWGAEKALWGTTGGGPHAAHTCGCTGRAGTLLQRPPAQFRGRYSMAGRAREEKKSDRGHVASVRSSAPRAYLLPAQ